MLIPIEEIKVKKDLKIRIGNIEPKGSLFKRKCIVDKPSCNICGLKPTHLHLKREKEGWSFNLMLKNNLFICQEKVSICWSCFLNNPSVRVSPSVELSRVPWSKGIEMILTNASGISKTDLMALCLNEDCCQHCGLKGEFFSVQSQDGSVTMIPYGFLNGVVMLNKDHIIPKKRGGKDRMSNYQLLCQPCNLKKGSR